MTPWVTRMKGYTANTLDDLLNLWASVGIGLDGVVRKLMAWFMELPGRLLGILPAMPASPALPGPQTEQHGPLPSTPVPRIPAPFAMPGVPAPLGAVPFSAISFRPE